MIGNNTIEMNQATLNAAVEHYLNTCVFKEAVTVMSVSAKSNGYSPMFEVKIEPKVKEIEG